MGRFRRAVVLGVVLTCLLARPASAQVPLPPPPALPPIDVPAEVGPLLAVAGPTAGPVCGTASLVTLLAPSLVQGYLQIPLSLLVDSATFRSYANTALYVCGFVPFSLTPTQCQADRDIIDALRGLNPLAAQVVGLFPAGATVDTVLALEALLPTGPSVAGPLADELEGLMTCSRSAGPPKTPTATTPGSMPPVEPMPTSTLPTVLAALPGGVGSLLTPALPSVVPVPEVTTPHLALTRTFETRFVPRSGTQWVGIAAGLLLLAGSVVAWGLGRRRSGPEATD